MVNPTKFGGGLKLSHSLTLKIEHFSKVSNKPSAVSLVIEDGLRFFEKYFFQKELGAAEKHSN